MQVKHVGSSPDFILDQNQEHAKTLLVTPNDEKNTSSRPIGHNEYNYGEKHHKNDLAQLFDSLHNFSTQDLPVVFPFPFPPSHHPSRFSPFSRETTGDESGALRGF